MPWRWKSLAEMEERRLFVHVGTHKTGTTSFQASLAENAQTLRAHGIAPLGLAKWDRLPWLRTTYNLTHFAHLFIRPELGTGPRLRGTLRKLSPDRQTVRRNRVAAKIAASPARDVVMSSEAFSFLRTPGEATAMGEFLGRCGRRPVFLLVLRNDADWRESWKNHLAHSRRIVEWIAREPDENRPEGEWYFDRASLTAFWRGLGELRVIDYDAARAAEGSVLPALFGEFGVDASDLELDFARNKRRKWRWPHALQRPLGR